jgi:hypothetical protein
MNARLEISNLNLHMMWVQAVQVCHYVGPCLRASHRFPQAPARRRSSRNVFNQVLAVTAMQRIPDAEVTPEEGPDAQNVGCGRATVTHGFTI